MNLSPSAKLFIDHGETRTLLLGSVSEGFSVLAASNDVVFN